MDTWPLPRSTRNSYPDEFGSSSVAVPSPQVIHDALITYPARGNALLLIHVWFPLASAEISPSTRTAIREAVRKVPTDATNIRVSVAGWTIYNPNRQHDGTLSCERAQALADALTEDGLPIPDAVEGRGPGTTDVTWCRATARISYQDPNHT